MKPSDVLTTRVIEPDWIVKDVLPRSTMVVLAGEAGAGKSFLAYSLAYAAAAGQPFLGFPTLPTRVLYFDEENGQPDFLQYNQWAWAALGCPDPAMLDQRLRLEHHSLVGGWKMAMRRALREHKPGLTIVDTATPAFHIQDENDNAEANRVINDLREMRREFADDTMTYLILKHEKQRDDTTHRRTIRGAKTWLGAVDQTLYHVIPRGARRRKDGLRRTLLEPDKLRAFALRQKLSIEPEWTETLPKGLILNARMVEDHHTGPLKDDD